MLSPFHPKIKILQEEFQQVLNARLGASFLAFMLGILLYFVGYPVTLCVVCFITGAIGWIIKHKNQTVSFLMMLVVFVSVGCLFGHIRAQILKHTVLKDSLYHSTITAMVRRSIILPDKQILDLENIQWPLGLQHRPEKIRLNFYKNTPVISEGSRVVLRANIMPPHTIQTPFQISQDRRLYFEKIGAIGKVEKILSIEPPKENPHFFHQLQNKISTYLLQILPEKQARIAIPLITGEQHFVLREQYNLYQRSGIAHVLSVSGFHMALLAAFLFLFVRGFCVLSHLTLYINAKKIAAFIALIGTGFYLALSGFQIPAVRSFGMIALVFLGILADRKAFSIRSLILIGFFMLLYAPENLLSISFQLSFLSVLILITTHEKFKQFQPEMNKYLHRFLEFCLLNIVITVGLIPLIAWHFNKITPYGLIGNMLFSFIFSLGIMPLLFTGCLLMPLGWGEPFFKMGGYLLENIEKGASFLVQLPFSQIGIASFERFWLCLMIAGIIALCLGRYWGKRFGVILLLIGLIGAHYTTLPDVIVSNHSIGFVQNNTFYQSKSGDSWLQNLWRQKLGLSKFQEIDLPPILTIKDKKIALSTSVCSGADYAILPYRDSRCRIPSLIPQKDQVYLIYIQNKQIKMTPLSE